MSKVFNLNLMQVITLSIFALLIFILNIPGTIALRNILSGSLLIIIIKFWTQANISITPILSNRNFRGDLIVLCVITFYILFHSIFIADEVSWSLSQYRTQWVYPIIYFIIGISLGSMTSKNNYFKVETLIALLFYSLLAHIVYIDLASLFSYFETGNLLIRYGGLTKSPVLSSYIANILIAMTIVEFLYRLREKKRMLQIGSFWLVIIICFCLVSSIIGGMRFGVISIFFMSLTACIFLVIDNNNFNNKAKSFVSLFILVLCMLPISYNAKNDVRWLSLIETIPIAIDTEANTYWKDRANLPTLANGDKVHLSNYLRIAWAFKGVEYVKNDVFGIGYGRNVFGHAIQKYEKNTEAIRGYHSHSGILDFTISLGIIGLFFWLFFVGKIIIYSTREFIKSGNYFSLMSLFITSGFFIRSIVDSNMRDHMFKQFFLILGISLSLAAFENIKKNNDP